jgi:hypothetical protein
VGRVAAAAVEDDGEVTKELSRNVERHLDRLVELLDLGRPTSPHSALEATAWNGQDVRKIAQLAGQLDLSRRHVSRLQVRYGSGFKVLPAGILRDLAEVAVFGYREVQEFLFNTSR